MKFETRKRNLSFLFLLIILVAEINNVNATVVRASSRSGKAPQVVQQTQQRDTKTNEQKQQVARQEKENDKKEEEAENEKREKPSDEDDQKGSFLPDMIRKIKCDKSKVRLIFREARKQGIKLSKTDVMDQFKTCIKAKAKANAKNLGSKEDKEQNEEEKTTEKEEEKDHLRVIFEDNFDGDRWNYAKWVEQPNKFSRISSKFSNGGKGMVFDGNAAGKSLNNNGTRTLTTMPFDASMGGTFSFDLKVGEGNGTGSCKREYLRLKKAEEDKKRLLEQEEKLKAEQAAKKKAEQAAKKRAEQAAKAKANEEKAKLRARQNDEENARQNCLNSPPCNGHGRGVYTSECDKKTWRCKNRQCKCNCVHGWLGRRCNTPFRVSQCQSVGDPHPLSLDGYRFNVYDAGEFVMFRHPDIPVEVRLLTRMAHPRISATAGLAISYKNPKDGKVSIMSVEQPHCGNGNNFKMGFVDNGKCVKGLKWGRRFSRNGLYYDGGRKLTAPGGINIYIGGWWRYRWWRGQCGSAYWLNAYVRVRAPRDGRSFGLCGGFGNGRNWDYRRLIASGGHRHHNQISRNARDTFKVDAKDSYFICGSHWNPGFRYSPYFKSLKQGQSLKQLQSAAAMVDSEAQIAREYAQDKILNQKTLGDEKEGDEKMGKEKALAVCKKKKDITTEEALTNCVNDLSMTADPEVEKVAAKESEEEEEEAADDIKADEEDEELEVAAEAKMKVADDFDVVVQWCGENCKNESNWKQLKAYPEKVYGDFLKDKYRRMTARLPKEAVSKKLQIRFYQKKHECFCCNSFFVDNVMVRTGGMPIAIVAEKSFELFADGKTLGVGEWWEPAKDTYRFRAPTETKVFAVKVEGGNDARMGVLAKLGPSLVTSSSWKCTIKEERDWQMPSFDDKHWPAAVEEGQNGILPWGERPGIAKKAWWIFTHDTYKMRGQTAYCRVNVADAKLSHSKEDPAASRWSCKTGSTNRQAPSSLQLNGDMMSSIEVRSGKEKDDHFSPGVSFTTKVEDGDESRVLMKIKMKQFMDKSMEGGMIKRAVIRLFVLDDSSNEIHLCKLLRTWSASDVTWMTQPAYDGPIENCIAGKATTKKDWADFDISDWVRDWISQPKSNFGMVLMPPAKDPATFVSSTDPDAEQRPRLSMSCHGDRADATQVFKATSVKITKVKKSK
jgi:hypothetical protein